MSDIQLPVILNSSHSLQTADSSEIAILEKARRVLDAGFPDHSLLDIWNAAVHNLRRRTELYGIDIFISAIRDIAGRKKYDPQADSLEDRWAGVDEAVLIEGTTLLGILGGKAGKALEMINWIRNHSSSAHLSNETVSISDVIGLALILQENLFNQIMPEAGHSPSGLFEPIKNELLNADNISILNDQIVSYNSRDIKTVFGFLLDYICKGEEPAYRNALHLFPTVWGRANEESKIFAGAKYHSFLIDRRTDSSQDQQAKIRLLELLVSVDGIKYIPDAARALIYRQAAQAIVTAKNTGYGWTLEDRAALALMQFGTCVPTIAFEDVYQEILSVWCGNYWGRSNAYSILNQFIECLNSKQIVNVASMFINNTRVRDELSQDKPKRIAITLLQYLRQKLTIQAHINDVDLAIDSVTRI